MSGKSAKGELAPGAGGYFVESTLPFTSLVAVIPLIIIYELGTTFIAAETGVETRIRAFNLLRQFLGWFGAGGRFIAPLAVVGILLTWHIARKDPCGVRPTTLGFLAVEALFLALPLVILAKLIARVIPLAAVDPGTPGMIVLSIGAGVYEELVFRLVLITLGHLLLVDLLKFDRSVAILIVVAWSSLTFSLYHYWWGPETFNWQSFTFRTAAGIYFASVFLTRGFAVSAYSHAFYDIITVVL